MYTHFYTPNNSITSPLCFHRSLQIKFWTCCHYLIWPYLNPSLLYSTSFCFLSLAVQAQLLRSSSGGSRSCTACCHCLTLLGINKVVTEASVWSCFILNIHAIMPAALTHFANSWVCPALCHLWELWVKGRSTVKFNSWSTRNDLRRFWHIFPQLNKLVHFVLDGG